MNNVYDECPIIENDRFLLRFVTKEDSDEDVLSAIEFQERYFEGELLR